jgi:protein-S-isoprenylcysteine O-methyltransferase Ste14
MIRSNGTRRSRPETSGLAAVLVVVILVIAALLVIALTLPLLSRSLVLFGIVASCCWIAIFAGAVAATRALGGRRQPDEASAGGEAQRAERVPDDSVAYDGRLERFARSAAEAEKSLD